MIFKRVILNEKFGEVPSWLSNRLNAVKPMSKTGDINPKFANTEYGDEIKPEYTPKWSKENPGIYSLYDQLINAGYDLANMKAEERPIPSKQSDLKDIEDKGLLPVWLLRDDSTNKTQIYIPGINDTEKTLYKDVIKNYRFLSRLPFKDLANDSVRFAVLDIPMKDPDQQAKRREWGDESTGISGKQRNPEFAGVSTSDGSMVFDKSGYNVAPNRERLKSRADELRNGLYKTIDKIEDAKEDVEEVIEDIPEIASKEDEKEINKALNKTIKLFETAEFLAKNLMFELEDYDEELLDSLDMTFNKIHDNFIGPLFYWAKEINNIRKHKEELFDNENVLVHGSPDSPYHRNVSDINIELEMSGDWIDVDTGEVYFTENYPLEVININLESIIDDLKNLEFFELDWE